MSRPRPAARRAAAGRFDQLTTSGRRPPPPAPAATAGASARARRPRPIAIRRVRRRRACTRTGIRLASCWRVSSSVAATRSAPASLRRRDHRGDRSPWAPRPTESAVAASRASAARSAPASRAGSAVVMSCVPQRPTRIFSSGNRDRSRLHRYRVCARPPGGVAAMQTAAGPPLGHPVEQLGGQGPRGDRPRGPIGPGRGPAGASPGPALVLSVVGRAAEDRDRRLGRAARPAAALGLGLRPSAPAAPIRPSPMSSTISRIACSAYCSSSSVMSPRDAVPLDGPQRRQQHRVEDLLGRSPSRLHLLDDQAPRPRPGRGPAAAGRS